MAKREIPEVNAGSMADIAFLLLIFFLVTTTMDSDTGLARTLPPIVPEDQPPPPPIKDRNVFRVLLNSQNQLLVGGEPMDISELREAAKEFIENPARKDDLPEFKEITVPLLGVVEVSKGVISLQSDRQTEYQAYLMVQNELAAAYNELRQALARKKFGKDYADLEDEEVKAIRSIYPQRISEAEPKNVGGKN